MFCTTCGKKLPEDAEGRPIGNFCPNCGAKIQLFADAAAAGMAAEAAEAAEKARAQAEAAAEAARTKAAEEAAAKAKAEAEAARAKAAAEAEVAKAKAARETEEAEDSGWKDPFKEEPAAEPQYKAADTEPEPVNTVEEIIPPAEPSKAPETIEEPPKKKSKAPIIILVLIAALAIGGFFVYQNLPSTKAAKLIKQADELAMQDKYEEGLELIREAMVLQPDKAEYPEKEIDMTMAFARYCEEGSEDVGALLHYAEATEQAKKLENSESSKRFIQSISDEISSIAGYYRDNGKYETALEILDAKAEILPENIAGITREKITVYEPWIQAMLEEPETTVLKVFKEMYLEKIMEAPEYSALQPLFDQVNDRLEASERLEKLGKLGKTFMASTEKDRQSNACNVFFLEFSSILSDNYDIYKWCKNNGDKLPLIASIPGTTQSIGIYETQGALFCYIGEYSGRKRSGNGAWFTYLGSALNTNRKYYARGTWENDLPNGEFTCWNYVKVADPASETEVTVKCNVKDGLFNGKAETVYKGVDTFRPEYVNGTPKILDTLQDENGTTRYVTAYGEDSTYYLSNTKGENYKDGVLGFVTAAE